MLKLLGINMSELLIDNQNGSKTQFNFKFDNGLPVKPIINPSYEIGYSEKNKYYVLSMFLTNENLAVLGDLNIQKIASDKNCDEIWLLINEHYVVFNGINDKIIKQLEEDKLVFYFLKENGEFINGAKI